MKEAFEKILEQFKQRRGIAARDKYESNSEIDKNYYHGVDYGFYKASEIVNEVADKCINDFCEWKIDGVYLHCQHNTELVISCLEEEKYRYKYCPVCGKKIKVVE